MKKCYDAPALFFVESVAHVLGEFLEFSLGLGVVSVDNEVLEVPESPAQVLKSLTLLKVAGDFRADLDYDEKK